MDVSPLLGLFLRASLLLTHKLSIKELEIIFVKLVCDWIGWLRSADYTIAICHLIAWQHHMRLVSDGKLCRDVVVNQAPLSKCDLHMSCLH